jgi:hypothetical protein
MDTVLKDGRRVIGLKYVPFNSAGARVTYPIKGSIVTCEKPLKTTYGIWSIDGKNDVVWGKGPDLASVPEGLVTPD